MTQVSQSASALVEQLALLDEEIRGLLLWPRKGCDPDRFQQTLRTLRAQRAALEERLVTVPTTDGDFALLRAG